METTKVPAIQTCESWGEYLELVKYASRTMYDHYSFPRIPRPPTHGRQTEKFIKRQKFLQAFSDRLVIFDEKHDRLLSTYELNSKIRWLSA